jgi:hypothetical protein
MPTIVLLDLGETLVSQGRMLPHVPRALALLATFRPAAPLCLVSDFDMAADPADVDRLFAAYVAAVRGFGLASFFDPPDERMTTSTLAGVRKPDPAIFRLALGRARVAGGLDGAVFVTEDAAHVAAARALGMHAWRFGGELPQWGEGPVLLLREWAPQVPDLVRAAVALGLETRHGLTLDPDAQADATRVQGRAGSHEVTVDVPRWGEPDAVVIDGRPAASPGDEALFRKTLIDNAQLAPPGATELAPGQTHHDDPAGPHPRRGRFSLT